MFYRKNVPGWERGLRILVGAAMVAGGVMLWGKPGAIALAAGGCFVALTGFVGFCPMCALAGRRLDAGK